MVGQQAESDLNCVDNFALALPVTQVGVERTFSSLGYILKELRLEVEEGIA